MKYALDNGIKVFLGNQDCDNYDKHVVLEYNLAIIYPDGKKFFYQVKNLESIVIKRLEDLEYNNFLEIMDIPKEVYNYHCKELGIDPYEAILEKQKSAFEQGNNIPVSCELFGSTMEYLHMSFDDKGLDFEFEKYLEFLEEINLNCDLEFKNLIEYLEETSSNKLISFNIEYFTTVRRRFNGPLHMEYTSIK